MAAPASEYRTLVLEFLEDGEWSSVFEASLLLFNGLCGYGLVIIPFAAKQLGILHGLWLLLALVVTFSYTARTLLTVADEQRAGSYATVAEKAFGTRGFLLASLCQLIFCLISMSVMLNIVADIAPPLLDASGASGIFQEDPLDSAQHEDDDHVIEFLATEAYPPSDSQRFLSLIVAAIIAFPFCLNYQLRSLRVLGYVTFSCLVPILVLVLLRSFAGRPTEDLGAEYGEGWYEPRTIEGFFKSVGVMSFAATSQHEVFAVYACLRRRTVMRFDQAMEKATFLAYLIFAFLAILGYCTFGRYLLPSLFSGFAVNELTTAPQPGGRRLDSVGDASDFLWTNYILRLLAAVVVMTSYPASMLVARQAACQFALRLQEICCPQRSTSMDSGGRLSFSEAYATRWTQGVDGEDGGSPSKLDAIADSLEAASRQRPKGSTQSLPAEASAQAGDACAGGEMDPMFMDEAAAEPSLMDWIPPTQRGIEAAVRMKDGGRTHSFDRNKQRDGDEVKTNERRDELRQPLLDGDDGMEYADWAAALEQNLKADAEFERVSHASGGSVPDIPAGLPPCHERGSRFAWRTCASSLREVHRWRKHQGHVAVTSGIHLVAILLGIFTLPSDLQLLGAQASVFLSLVLPACVYLRLGLVSDYGAVACFGLLPHQIRMAGVLVAAAVISVMVWYAHIALWCQGAS